MGTQTAQPTSWSEKRMVRLPKACDSLADGCSVVSNLDGIEAGPRCGMWNGLRGGVGGCVRVVALGVRSVGVVSASVASLVCACAVTTSSGRRTFTRAAVASLAANCEISGGGPFWMRPFLFLPTWRYDTRMAEPPRPSIEAATDPSM